MEDCVEFGSFLPLQQSPVYAAAAATLGARVRWLDVGCGRALAIERGRLRVVMRGPVWQSEVGADVQRAALRRLARWPGLTLVTPDAPVKGFGLIPLATPQHHAVWDLRGDLRAGMSGKWRNRLVAAEAAGLRPQPGNASVLDRLIAAETRQRLERRYLALPEAFTRALPQAALRLWQWRQAGEMAAAMAFVVHGTSASYHLAWASDSARAAGAHAVMLTHAASALSAEGVRWLDLGAVDTEAAPGLARFKLGTAAVLRSLGPTLLVLP